MDYLVRKQGQQSREGTEASCEEDEEWKLLLRVDGHLVEGWEQLAVSALGAARIGVEEVSLLQRVRDQAKGAFPRTMKQVHGSLHSLPMLISRKKFSLRPVKH